MRISCKKTDLLMGVNIVSKAVPTRTTLSALKCILIDASGDSINLIANDTELGIETIVEGKIEERGIVAIEASTFTDQVRELPDDCEVSIETDEKFNITLRFDTDQVNLFGRSGEDFSYLPVFEKNEPIIISQFTLKEIIRQTIFSISDNDANRMMTGELFEIEDNRLKVVALDGHRVSIRNVELSGFYDKKSVVVPGKTLNEISKILNGSTEDEVRIFIIDSHIIFEFGNSVVVSRLIDGEFFRIDYMLTSDYETKVKINKRDLLSRIHRATLLAKEGDKKPVILDIIEGNVNISISSIQGSMDSNIPIEKSGKDLKIGFSPKFFIDALKVIDEEEITLYMTNSKAPCFIRDEDMNYIYLILPVNF